jgi:chemotaxis-related protein WspB
MLFLIFEVGRDRYALDVREVAEVLPLVGIKHVPQAPPAVAGILNYRGAPVPVIDVSQLAIGQPAARRLSTRIVLVHYVASADDRSTALGAGAEGRTQLLGLIAERATQTMRRDESDFIPPGVFSEGASYLGPVAADADGFVQRVDVQALLPASVRELLFKQTTAR